MLVSTTATLGQICILVNWATRMNVDGSGPLSLLDDQANIPVYPTAKIENSKHSAKLDSQPDPENIIRTKGEMLLD